MASEEIDYFNTPEDSERLYKLLGEAKAAVGRCRKARNGESIGTDGALIPPDKIDAYCRLQINEFSKEFQWAKWWIQQEHADKPGVSTEIKINYQKQWMDYFDRIYRWADSVLFPKDGNPNILIEYRALENIRDGLFWQSCELYRAETEHLEVEAKRLEAKVSRLDAESIRPAKEAETRIDSTNTKQNQERKQEVGDKSLEVRYEKAYQSYCYAVEKNTGIETDKQAYDWLKENGCEDEDYQLPSFETWQRYVQSGRKYHGTQKNKPRGGRTGRSVVQRKDL